MAIARETSQIFADHTILTSHNVSVAELNSDVLKTINGGTQTFTSVDSAEQRSEDEAFYMNNEYLYTLKALGIPLA